MTRASKGRKLLMGALAGLLGSIAGLILIYVVAVPVIFVKTQEVLGAVLAALTFLPLMLILVVFLPNLVLGILIGLVIAAMGHWRSRILGFAAGMVIGFICAEVMFSIVLPLIMPPEPGDFVSIVANPYLTGTYGVSLGLLTNCFFSWFNPRDLA